MKTLKEQAKELIESLSVYKGSAVTPKRMAMNNLNQQIKILLELHKELSEKISSLNKIYGEVADYES